MFLSRSVYDAAFASAGGFAHVAAESHAIGVMLTGELLARNLPRPLMASRSACAHTARARNAILALAILVTGRRNAFRLTTRLQSQKRR